MPFRIVPADHDSLRVPVHRRAHIRRAIAQRQAAATAIGFIGLRTMQEQVAVQRGLARRQLHVDRIAILLRVLDRLIENCSRRRDAALRNLEKRRDELATRMRNLSSNVSDGAFVEVSKQTKIGE